MILTPRQRSVVSRLSLLLLIGLIAWHSVQSFFVRKQTRAEVQLLHDFVSARHEAGSGTLKICRPESGGIIAGADCVAEKILGYERGELNGKSLSVVFRSLQSFENHTKAISDFVNHAGSKGSTYISKREAKKKDGTTVIVWLRTFVSPSHPDFFMVAISAAPDSGAN